MSEKPQFTSVVRQTVPLQGTSCDMRVGEGALDQLSGELRLLVGAPKRAALVACEGTSEDLLEECRRQLSDAGFAVSDITCELGRSVASALPIFSALDAASITADDVIVAVGNSDTLSLMSFVTSSWCAGVTFVVVCTDLLACAQAVTTPLSLDVPAGHELMVNLRSWARMAFCDLRYVSLERNDALEEAFALFVATAVCDNNDGFDKLVARAADLVALDVDALVEQTVETARIRGRITTSTALAVRQAISYGQVFVEGMRELFDGVPNGILLAEGMRVLARLATSSEDSDGTPDFVFTQDALLSKLGLGEVAVDVEPAELIDAMREVCFRRSNRFLLPLPLRVGRVRLGSVAEPVLNQHLAAWCEARRALLEEEA